MLEQRVGQPIHIDLPYVDEMKDEKVCRVVMDRDQRSGVVMGERISLDASTTERLAQRVPVLFSLAES